MLNSPLVAAGGIVLAAAMFLCVQKVEEEYTCMNTPSPQGCSQLTGIAENVLAKRDGEYVSTFTEQTDANSLHGALQSEMPETFQISTRCSDHVPWSYGGLAHQSKGAVYIDWSAVNSFATGASNSLTSAQIDAQYCAMLGCNWKQCLTREYTCESRGEPARWQQAVDGDGNLRYPKIFCSRPMPTTKMAPGAFVGVFSLFVLGIFFCVAGCVAGMPPKQA